MQLILASASIGREYLLKGLGIPFRIIPSEIDEDKIVGKNLVEIIKMRAKLKGESVAGLLVSSHKLPRSLKEKREYLILSADTEVILDNQLIGKPKDYKDAVRILSALSGKTHEVVSGFYIIKLSTARSSMQFSKIAYETLEPTFYKKSSNKILKQVQNDNADKDFRHIANKKIASTSDVLGFDRSLVTFRKLSKEDITLYLSLTEYTRFTGSYALVASPQNFITKIEGSISNVIGLPLEKVIPVFKKNNLLFT